MIIRRRNRHNSTSSYSKVQDATSNDDIRYFVEKMKNKSGTVFSSKSQTDEPAVFQSYKDFLKEYIQFTLSNITKSYETIVDEWMTKHPALVDKIKFVDSSNIEGVIFKNVSEYAERKLRPGIISSVTNRYFKEDDVSNIWTNTETYNPPALAFLGPPGTAKTNAITSALASLAQGGENRLVWDWLRYDITTHEVTTAPLVLPIATGVVTDNPLTTVALMKSTGIRDIDIALTENIQTKTLSKAIATFAYILRGGNENGHIQIRPDVRQQLDNNIITTSLNLATWKFVTTDSIKADNINQILKPLIDALSNRLAGFKHIVESIDKFAKENKSVGAWIDYIESGEYLDDSVKNKLAIADKYADSFREVCRLLNDLIIFGLTPVIADTFRNFFIDLKGSEIKDEGKENIENGVMYVYNRIHNDYLHRIISRIFLLYALFNIGKKQEEMKKLFQRLIGSLQDGLDEMLQEYKAWILNNSIKEYTDLDDKYLESGKQITGEDNYRFYDEFNGFLLKIEPNVGSEKHGYKKIDVLFIEKVVSRFSAGSVDQVRNFSAKSKGYNTSNKVYVDAYDKAVDDNNDRYYSANRLSFIDALSIITDDINDVNELNRYYSNNPDEDLRTTAQRLGDSFGRRFLDLANDNSGSTPYHLSVVFSFVSKLVNLYNNDAGKIKWNPSEYLEDIIEFKDSLEELFKKSLSIITNNPKLGIITKNQELQSKNIDIFGIVADYVLARLGVVESVYTPGAVYSFPAPIQIFLKKARDSYMKVLNETKIDINNPNPDVKLPMYVLFIDEILTKLTNQDFTFWLNIWNGLVSPNSDINQAFPPNVCFIVAGNMPSDWRLLAQALLQRSGDLMETKPGDQPQVGRTPSEDTLNALGSRINLYIVTYDYSYLMRTDDSTIKKRTNLFITSLVDEVLSGNNNIALLDTAINVIGGFYDYYKSIVSKRLSVIAEQNNEELARLHAYIASLTARANVTPYNIDNIEYNRTIAHLIRFNHGSNITSAAYKDIVTKATKLNYLFNSTVFGKSIYKHMLLDYFKSNKEEAIYFKRMMAIVLSPVILHMSFLHAYLTWNNMMRNIADELFNIGSNELSGNKSSYYSNIMKIMKDASFLVNTSIASHEEISNKLSLQKYTAYANDRVAKLSNMPNSVNFIKLLETKKDIRYCHPYVGAVIGLLTIAFYNYIKYIKKFNPNISNSIIDLCKKVKYNIVSGIKEESISPNIGTNDNTPSFKMSASDLDNIIKVFSININNYFIDKDYKRTDVIFEKSKKTSDNGVEIKVVAFNKNINVSPKDEDLNVEMPYENNDDVYTDAIAVRIHKTGQGANNIDERDIEAIKALVEYTFYTYAYNERKGYIDTPSLADYVLGSSSGSKITPIIGRLMSGFFRSSELGKTFVVEPLRDMDRWFTNVSSSVIRYITTMSILKHILTYIYNTGDSKNLIVSFIDSITENMNKINTRVKGDFDALLNEFSSLLSKYKEVVFTPLATQEQEFHLFSYDYYGMSGATKEYDGYYMNPRNLVNFGDLGFISKNLKGKDIIQIKQSEVESYITEIAFSFVDSIKELGVIPTTFLPIHLVSHLDTTPSDSTLEGEVELTSGNIVLLIKGKVGTERIEGDAFRNILEPDNDKPEEFYNIKVDKCADGICGIMQVLSVRLSAINKEQYPNLKEIIEYLLDKNKEVNSMNGKNLLAMLLSVNPGYENLQKMILEADEGIFKELKSSRRKYPSVGEYLDLWNNKKTQEEIKQFAVDILHELAKLSGNNDSRIANQLIQALDAYIQKAATEIATKLNNIFEQYADDKPVQKIKALLNRLINANNNLDKLIKDEIVNLINELKDKDKHLSNDISLHGNEIIEHHFRILTPLIKYSLAILLSNILLAKQKGNLEGHFNDIYKSFATSYSKVSSDNRYEENEYFDILVRYIFYDMNRKYIGDANQLMVYNVDLIIKDKTEVSIDSGSGVALVTPVFTGEDDKKAKVHKKNNTIMCRSVYTQYEYIEEGQDQINLYCDIHHMPVKGMRGVDGIFVKFDPIIYISANNECPDSKNKPTISYTDITFLKDWVVPLYEFAPSNLVNTLLIIGISVIQEILFRDHKNIELAKRLLPFVITNMYKYYKGVIDANKSKNNDKINVNEILQNIIDGQYKKPIHPLIPSIALAINRDQEKIRERLRKDYGMNSKEGKSFSRHDNFMRDLRLRFYSTPNVTDVKYNMYTIYEPGVVIQYN